ncbi:uncharacterized protein LOC113202714 [Frankliniella occidentalis]|uniref:Uncharacterized protein LOC113202714 n=1 Tax=Frankliniella occidentalis TaxID=133901 RepID=A0A6J1RX16_FRAOC|nr:uncharacterized protein LOC113202714 [Frankliniella occidentalis]
MDSVTPVRAVSIDSAFDGSFAAGPDPSAVLTLLSDTTKATVMAVDADTGKLAEATTETSTAPAPGKVTASATSTGPAVVFPPLSMAPSLAGAGPGPAPAFQLRLAVLDLWCLLVHLRECYREEVFARHPHGPLLSAARAFMGCLRRFMVQEDLDFPACDAARARKRRFARRDAEERGLELDEHLSDLCHVLGATRSYLKGLTPAQRAGLGPLHIAVELFLSILKEEMDFFNEMKEYNLSAVFKCRHSA